MTLVFVLAVRRDTHQSELIRHSASKLDDACPLAHNYTMIHQLVMFDIEHRLPILNFRGHGTRSQVQLSRCESAVRHICLAPKYHDRIVSEVVKYVLGCEFDRLSLQECLVREGFRL